MLRLAVILNDSDISISVMARMMGKHPATLYEIIHSGARKQVKTVRAVENAVRGSGVMMQWLKSRELPLSVIWDDVKKIDIKPGILRRKRDAARRRPPIVLGDPCHIPTPHKEAIMITHKALKHFKLFRNPFVNEIGDVRDIFMSGDHIFIKEMMLDAARYAGFTAVYGEVGCGKSVMRKAVVQELIADGIRVIYPMIVDKARITPASLIDAVVMDISEESPKRSLEQKTRQALRLLKNRAASGLKQVLIIEEAHLLDKKAFKSLKQIYELEDGFSKLVGIILIGQTELKSILDESQTPEIREVIRRVTRAEIIGLGSELSRYLAHKFTRQKRAADDVFTPDAYEAMTRRLQSRPTGRGAAISTAYPLTINNLAATAMNFAAGAGEEKVSGEIIINL